MSDLSQASQPDNLSVAGTNRSSTSNLRALAKSVPPARGFGAPNTPRYEQLFDDCADHTSLGSAGGFSGWDYWQASEQRDEAEPYQDTLLLIHSNRRGVRISFQASRRVILFIVIIILVILIKPGILDMIVSLVRSALGGK